jgi:hypothetical protein
VTWVPLTVSKVTVTTLLAVAETSRVSQMMASHLWTSPLRQDTSAKGSPRSNLDMSSEAS